jgi:hypothetical protein
MDLGRIADAADRFAAYVEAAETAGLEQQVGIKVGRVERDRPLRAGAPRPAETGTRRLHFGTEWARLPD